MKKVITVLLISAFVACIGSSAQAILITSGAGTHVNDHFEDDTVGSVPTNHPPWGVWKDGTSNVANDRAYVTDAGAPGPNKGENYLDLFRSNNSNGRAQVYSEFATPAAGGTFHMEFGINITSGSDADNIGPLGGPNYTNIVSMWIEDFAAGVGNLEAIGLYFWPENNISGEIRYYDGATWSYIDVDAFVADAWVNISLDHVMGSSALTLTVEDTVKNLSIALGGFNEINQVSISESTSGSGFYFDGWVPEPATLAVLALGGVLSLIRRRRR